MREETSGLGEKKRSIWDLFSMTENGHLKSTFLLYSFALGFLDLGGYLAAYLLLLDPLEAIFGGIGSVFLVNLLESVVPAAAGTALLLLPMKAARDKRIVPAGFLWMTFFLLGMAALLVFSLEGEDRTFLLSFCALFLPAPVLLGNGASIWLYLRQRDS